MKALTTQAERSAATREALKTAGRALFTAEGYQNVTTQMLVEAAGVSRRPLYHQFGDKLALFEAIFDDLERDVAARILLATQNSGVSDPLGAMRTGLHEFMEVISAPDAIRIAVIEAPIAFGWQRWHDRGTAIGVPLIEAILVEAMARGQVAEQNPRPLAHLLVGAAIEAAYYVSQADDAEVGKAEMIEVLDRMIRSFGPA